MKRLGMAGCCEVLLYAALVVLVHVGAVVPHVLDFGWAWSWPGAGFGLLLSLLTSVLILGIGVAALIRALVAPKVPRLAVVLRLLAVPVLVIGPGVLFDSFGGLATSEGRGLAARLRYVTPLDELQSWAVAAVRDGEGTPRQPLPARVARTLPSHCRVRVFKDHVSLWWYLEGVQVGAADYRLKRPSYYFFADQVRPGIFAVVVEK